MAEETIEGAPGSAFPDDPERARDEIRRTRQRMSGTIDEIEDLLTERKERVKAQLDVTARFRRNPLPVLGAVLGAGLLLGLLTGGDDDDEQERHQLRLEEDGAVRSWRDRAETWEARSRRLLRVAREQEDEIADLRAALQVDDWFDDEELDEELMDEFRPEEEEGVISQAVGSLVSALLGRSRVR